MFLKVIIWHGVTLSIRVRMWVLSYSTTIHLFILLCNYFFVCWEQEVCYNLWR